jgi:hypothetical protein
MEATHSSNTMVRRTSTAGAIAGLVVAVTGFAWFALETAAPRLGFDDTDDPAVSLRFLREHAEIHAQAGVILLAMAVALVVLTIAVSEVLAPRGVAVARRSATAIGLFSAAYLFMHGVIRLSVRPLLYIDGLDQGWGEAAYLVQQIVGIHGFAQGAITALCLWVVGTSLIGWRTKTLPLALCVLGLIPAFRLIGVVGPLGILPDDLGGLWIAFMVTIPATFLWCAILGLVLLRRTDAAVPDRLAAPV